MNNKENRTVKITTLRISCIAAALLAPLTFTTNASTGDADQAVPQSRLTARVTMLDGASRTVKLVGVGCSVSICSRTVIQGNAEGKSLVTARLDAIAAIKETTGNDALLVMKDGTQRRLSLVKDFRVLYLANGSGATEKVDLSKIKSIEFPSVR